MTIAVSIERKISRQFSYEATISGKMERWATQQSNHLHYRVALPSIFHRIHNICFPQRKITYVPHGNKFRVHLFLLALLFDNAYMSLGISITWGILEKNICIPFFYLQFMHIHEIRMMCTWFITLRDAIFTVLK